MNKKIDIPVIGVPPDLQKNTDLKYGADSQPQTKDYQYLELPKGMETFSMPSTNLEARPEVLAGTIEVLKELCTKMAHTNFNNANHQQIRVELTNSNPEVVKLLDETMGNGEVSIIVEEEHKKWLIQESVFTGIWRENLVENDKIISDYIVVGKIPKIVINKSFLDNKQLKELLVPPAKIMNAQAILAEIKEVAARYNSNKTSKTHIINLSLLPATPEDLQYISDTLGKGQAVILSRGFGNCRIAATQYQNVWWVQFFNSSEVLILNTIEITDMPETALAANEDFDSSLERLKEWLAAISQ